MSILMRAFVLPVALIACDVWSAPHGSDWLAQLPREFAVEHFPGITRVNGVGLRIAVARTPLSIEAAQRAIVASWQGGDEPLGMHRLGESLVISRRERHWHDTATVASDAQASTRVTFSRIDLRKRVDHAHCTISLPRNFVPRSITQSQVGAVDAMQCIFAAQMSRTTAARTVESALQKHGWHALGGGAWERGAEKLRTSIIDGRNEVLVLLLSMPRGLS